MLGQFAKFLNSLCNAAPKLYELYRQGQHDDKIVELLECFFIMGDLVETADELLDICRGKDAIIFSELDENELQKHYGIVQSKLTIQLQRLQRMEDIFLENPTIELLDADIQKDLKRAIGGKEQGLYHLGAGLFFNQMLGDSIKENELKDDWMRRVVMEKYEFSESICDLKKFSIKDQKEIVVELRVLRHCYRDILDKIAEPKHKTLFATKAKELAKTYSVRV
ncbi:hypothetical protein AN395_03521 [Pseudoalteromonas sp. P1-30]|uniref:Uncharacterized protein n=1 Tax=Pseudoalteromonas undina TaxID=43660 RepID=A0ACC6R2G2_9GAMM|nr:hypothetical protein [Pseudoalteromonas sp. P1-30]KPV90060.1 hypothetical protein AN395_03521 [Pseudoalteromonas sp. P1-30]